MKHECEVVRDLMPLVVDGTASMKSCTMVDEHVAECQPCREMLEEMRQEVEAGAPTEQAAKLVRKLRLRRLLRRVLLVLLGVALSLALLMAGRRYWSYYYNDFCVLTAEENYAVEVVPQGFYGAQTIYTLKDGNEQVGNSYFDDETGDLYFWSTTTRKSRTTKTLQHIYGDANLFSFEDIGYAYRTHTWDEETEKWYLDIVPVNRIIKGAPEWFRDEETPWHVISERVNPPDDALKDEWRTRLEAWGIELKPLPETE